MIRLRKSDDRGHTNFGWLDSRHTFSFGSYRDPDHMGYRVLRVINEDRVLADCGFGTHPHSNMEIVSYVVSGELEHKDSMENGSIIKTGEFQVMSAGTGITHSEFNPSKVKKTHFYQVWILPDTEDLTPNYAQKSFAHPDGDTQLHLVASKTGEQGALLVNQDVSLYRSLLSAGQSVEFPLKAERHGWIQVIAGVVEFDGITLTTGDGAAVSEIAAPTLTAGSKSELLFFDLP